MGKPTSGGAGGSGGRGRDEPAAVLSQIIPPPIVPPPPARNITVDGQRGIDQLQKLFGRQLSANDLADMIGAPDGSTITVTPGRGKTRLEVKHPLVTKMKQEIRTGVDGANILYNEYIMLKKTAPKGMGTAIINKQVEMARQLGIKKIGLYAAGHDGSAKYNGYYTWPRLGFDATMYSYTVKSIPSEILNTMRDNTVVELYRTQAGRDWWRLNGRGMGMEFDTSPNSKSSQALDAYNEERRNRSG